MFIILELTHEDLVTCVAPRVTTKLQKIGTALVLTPSELDDIEENHQVSLMCSNSKTLDPKQSFYSTHVHMQS